MLYTTTANNSDGVAGHLTFSDHAPLLTKHPLTDGEGLNPEQLIAAAWSTCLNATIQSLLDGKGIPGHSHVAVSVSLCKEESEPGYYFAVHAQASISALPLEQSQEIVNQAHQRCPISKLLQGAKTLRLETVVHPSNQATV